MNEEPRVSPRHATTGNLLYDLGLNRGFCEVLFHAAKEYGDLASRSGKTLDIDPLTSIVNALVKGFKIGLLPIVHPDKIRQYFGEPSSQGYAENLARRMVLVTSLSRLTEDTFLSAIKSFPKDDYRSSRMQESLGELEGRNRELERRLADAIRECGEACRTRDRVTGESSRLINELKGVRHEYEEAARRYTVAERREGDAQTRIAHLLAEVGSSAETIRSITGLCGELQARYEGALADNTRVENEKRTLQQRLDDLSGREQSDQRKDSSFEERIEAYLRATQGDQTNPVLYLFMLREIFDSTGEHPPGEREEQVTKALERIEQLRATDFIVDLALMYAQEHSFRTAESILTRVVNRCTSEVRAYMTLAEIIREQNVGNSFDQHREEYAKWLEWKAEEVGFKNKISEYQKQLDDNPESTRAYMGLLHTLMAKTAGVPGDGEREYALYTLFKLTELGATSDLLKLVGKYVEVKQYPAAEFILTKLKNDESKDHHVYEALASVVRAQNIEASFNQEREQYARWLEWKANELVRHLA